MSQNLNIDASAALALFEFLSRTLDDEKGEKLRDVVIHDGELWALNRLLGALEKELTAPFETNYQDQVNAAFETLVIEAGAWPTSVQPK